MSKFYLCYKVEGMGSGPSRMLRLPDDIDPPKRRRTRTKRNRLNNNNTNSNNIPVTLAVNNTTNNTQNSNNFTAKQVVYKSLDGDDENSKSETDQENKSSKLMGIFKKAMKVITPKESDNNDSKKLFAVTL